MGGDQQDWQQGYRRHGAQGGGLAGGGSDHHHRGDNSSWLTVGVSTGAGRAPEGRHVGHQGPGGCAEDTEAWELRSLLQMGRSEDPTSVELMCKHQSCQEKLIGKKFKTGKF